MKIHLVGAELFHADGQTWLSYHMLFTILWTCLKMCITKQCQAESTRWQEGSQVTPELCVLNSELASHHSQLLDFLNICGSLNYSMFWSPSPSPPLANPATRYCRLLRHPLNYCYAINDQGNNGHMQTLAASTYTSTKHGTDSCTAICHIRIKSLI